MPLTPGSRLGPYEILSSLGAGGMGEVYRARDTKLGRDVALKILPDAFISDPERLARFQREAQVLASLNHQHIGAIYGLEDSDGVRALVLELVEGPTLADRITQGPIPLDETLPIAKQIAEALESAHEQGVIHRDLKPANIKVRPDGIVKVLDFGLAKLTEAPAASVAVGLSQSPTITTPAMMTGVGMILGTAAYMSPEQAKGKAADKRSDVWAFGCVLFEMLTGKRAFEGEDVSDTLAAVLRAEPDWRQLDHRVGPAIARVVRRCLAKDRRERLRDVGDVKLELADAVAEADSRNAPARSSAVGRQGRRLLWPGIAAASTLALAAAAPLLVSHWRERPPDVVPVKFTIALPSDFAVGDFGVRLAVSPDGRRIALVAREGATADARIFVRDLDQETLQPVRGTEGATGTPFWSPDSRDLAFISGNRLKRVAMANGGVQTICDVEEQQVVAFGTGAWNTRGDIVFSTNGLTGFRRVSSAGGTAVPLLTPRKDQGETRYLYPEFLPDQRHFAFSAVHGQSSSTIEIGSVDDNAVTHLLDEAGHSVLVAPDQLAFWRNGSVFVQRFNARSRTVEGEATGIASDVVSGGFGRADTRSAFSLSRTNVLAYQSGGDYLQAQLTWVDRSGRELGVVGGPAALSTMQLSPDEQFVAVGRRVDTSSSTNIWVIDLRRDVSSRLTFGSERESNPSWSPDGKRIAFNSLRKGLKSLYEMSAASSGGETLLLQAAAGSDPLSVSDRSKDGRFLLFNKDASRDLWALPLDGTERTPIVVVHPPLGRSDQPNFSPDGRFIAYNSDESGRAEVYVVPFPPTGERWQVSSAGGVQPRWRGDGRELVYLAPDGMMMSADVIPERRFETRAPHALFRTTIAPLFQTEQFAMTRDGQRFLMMKPLASTNAGPTLTVVLNWMSLPSRP